jgi:hypothetical protein
MCLQIDEHAATLYARHRNVLDPERVGGGTLITFPAVDAGVRLRVLEVGVAEMSVVVDDLTVAVRVEYRADVSEGISLR